HADGGRLVLLLEVVELLLQDRLVVGRGGRPASAMRRHRFHRWPRLLRESIGKAPWSQSGSPRSCARGVASRSATPGPRLAKGWGPHQGATVAKTASRPAAARIQPRGSTRRPSIRRSTPGTRPDTRNSGAASPGSRARTGGRTSG